LIRTPPFIQLCVCVRVRTERGRGGVRRIGAQSSITYTLGDAGPFALAGVIYHHLGRTNKSEVGCFTHDTSASSKYGARVRVWLTVISRQSRPTSTS
jgi:hypothetical protein